MSDGIKKWIKMSPRNYIYVLTIGTNDVPLAGIKKTKKEWEWYVGGGSSPGSGTLNWAKKAAEGTFFGVDNVRRISDMIAKGTFTPLNKNMKEIKRWH